MVSSGHGVDGVMQMHFGGDGLPFLTKKSRVPEYKNSYPAHMQPKAVRHVSVDVLDLSNEVDFAYYLKIWKATGLGSAQVVDEDKHWVEDKQNWKVFIRWFIKGKMDPSEFRSEVASATRSLRNGPELLVNEGA